MKLNDKLMEKALRQFADYGIYIEKFDTVKQKIYITVPSETDCDLQGGEIADFLKNAFSGTPIESFKVLYKVRDEKWTKEKSDEAIVELRESVKNIFAEKGIYL